MMSFEDTLAICSICTKGRIVCDHVGIVTDNCPFPFNVKEREEDNETNKK